MTMERTEISAGGVLYRRVGGEIEVAIAEQRDRITANRTIRLPKGKIDPGETAQQAAVREVVEETGFQSRVVCPLGSAQYFYDDTEGRVSKEVHYFLLEWIDAEPLEPDGEMDRIYWTSIADAQRTLTFETEKRAMDWARAQLEAS
jgi:8-oxo-dGTP pyrophosphatase MutT (NUDIX family)